jgi:hypothetical protein
LHKSGSARKTPPAAQRIWFIRLAQHSQKLIFNIELASLAILPHFRPIFRVSLWLRLMRTQFDWKAARDD